MTKTTNDIFREEITETLNRVNEQIEENKEKLNDIWSMLNGI